MTTIASIEPILAITLMMPALSHLMLAEDPVGTSLTSPRSDGAIPVDERDQRAVASVAWGVGLWLASTPSRVSLTV